MAEGAGSSQCPWDLCEVRKHVGGMSRKEESQQHANSRTWILQKQTAVENKKKQPDSLCSRNPEITSSSTWAARDRRSLWAAVENGFSGAGWSLTEAVCQGDGLLTSIFRWSRSQWRLRAAASGRSMAGEWMWSVGSPPMMNLSRWVIWSMHMPHLMYMSVQTWCPGIEID